MCNKPSSCQSNKSEQGNKMADDYKLSSLYYPTIGNLLTDEMKTVLRDYSGFEDGEIEAHLHVVVSCVHPKNRRALYTNLRDSETRHGLLYPCHA